MVQGRVPEHELAAVYDPMLNLILQGSKSMTVGDRILHYDPATYFVMSVNLPAVGTVHSSASGAPYLAVNLTLDPTVIGSLLSDLPRTGADDVAAGGVSVAPVTPELLDAWVRMLRQMDRPDDIPALAPAYQREILYRVLQGPHAAMLRDKPHQQTDAPDPLFHINKFYLYLSMPDTTQKQRLLSVVCSRLFGTLYATISF